MIGRRPISRAKGNGDVPGILGRFLGTSCRKMYFHLLQFSAWLNSSDGQAFVLSLRLRRQLILSQFEQVFAKNGKWADLHWMPRANPPYASPREASLASPV